MMSGFHLPSVKLQYGVLLLYLAVYKNFEITHNVDPSLEFI